METRQINPHTITSAKESLRSVQHSFGVGVKKKRVCVITTNRSDYGRMKPVMEAIQKEPNLELQVVAGTPLFFDHLLWYFRHGEPLSWWRSLPWLLKARWMALTGDHALMRHEQLMKLLVRDGFPIHARLPMFLEGGNHRVMTKTVGLTLLGLPDIFEKLRPDIVLFNGDRFEILPIAFAAVSMNIPIAHIEGGDVSGTIDESVRHAVTKLAHIHFPATKKSAARLIAMGENPAHVFVTGSPVIDTLVHGDRSLDNSVFDKYPAVAGGRIDVTKPFICIMQHPVTTRAEKNRSDMEQLIAAVDQMPIQKLFLTPNIDAGSDGVSAALREYRGRVPSGAAFYKYFTPDDFYRIFSNAAVVVGNSSSFIRESAFLGIPAVVVGNRQQGRERGENVIETGCITHDIIEAIAKQIPHGKYRPSTLFGDGTASGQIARILATVTPPVQKIFYE